MINFIYSLVTNDPVTHEPNSGATQKSKKDNSIINIASTIFNGLINVKNGIVFTVRTINPAASYLSEFLIEKIKDRILKNFEYSSYDDLG